MISGLSQLLDMEKRPVKDVPGLFRLESGAIINCSDSEYNNYMEAKRLKLKELEEKQNEKEEGLLMPFAKYSRKHKKLARVASPRDKITGADFKKLKKRKKKK